MVKVKCDDGEMEIEVYGSGAMIMAELCCIVDSVCERFTEDEEDSEGMKNMMIKMVATALKAKVNASEKLHK